jgi:hypothetical protein
MLLRYFADGAVFDIEVPEGSAVEHHSHKAAGPGSFLDDVLLVPWQGRLAPIPGEALPALAGRRMYGMDLLAAHNPALWSDAREASPVGTAGESSRR